MHRRSLFLIIAVLALFAAACGGEADDAADVEATAAGAVDDAMTEGDAMADDAMTEADDAMSEGDAMADDAMSEGDAMADDAMTEADDAMSEGDAMADDAMSEGDDAMAEHGGDATYELTLTGDAEVPDPGAEGTAEVTVTFSDGEFCIEGETTDVGAIADGHIHVGSATEAGDVVVPLGVMTDGDGPIEQSCAEADEETSQTINATPGNFYVNLHTEEFPMGAVRAQMDS